ncbi:transcription initiation factor IIB family protein [Salinarchaeum sp. IM2453]|uniref:cyclin family protein n=1 Tax=Salinarchaeum sp. IM2453 TaxID=2862870 RepID=UPI001C83FB0F|nr:cyclin family protein [Salinarchaeum sp. IM2453]QZA88798.1 transcription initiation factor IIB family protein [Salinarchaeum sp. IM2453]
MYRARDQVEHQQWIERLESAVNELGFSEQAYTTAVDLFLADVPEEDESKPTALAASLYAGALIAEENPSQTEVADACDVARLSVQQYWKERIKIAGLTPPAW